MEYLVAALLGGFLFFNSQATPDRAENEVAKVLQARFPGAAVDVDIEGKRGRDVLRGRFKKLDVSMQNINAGDPQGDFSISAVPDAKNKGRLGETSVQLRDIVWDGLTVELVEVSVRDLVYDFSALKDDNELKIVSSGPVKANLIVPAAALEKYLKTRLKDIENPKLTLQNERVQISGRRNLPIVNAPVDFLLTSRLEIRRGNEIWLVEPKLTFQDSPMAIPAGPLLAGLNPVYIIDKEKQWPYRVQITRAQARNNKLQLSANLSFVPATKVAVKH